MGIRAYKPTSAGRRFYTVSDFAEITTDTPEKSLVEHQPQTGGSAAGDGRQRRIALEHADGVGRAEIEERIQQRMPQPQLPLAALAPLELRTMRRRFDETDSDARTGREVDPVWAVGHEAAREHAHTRRDASARRSPWRTNVEFPPVRANREPEARRIFVYN